MTPLQKHTRIREIRAQHMNLLNELNTASESAKVLIQNQIDSLMAEFVKVLKEPDRNPDEAEAAAKQEAASFAARPGAPGRLMNS
jgi:hypothetical protein